MAGLSAAKRALLDDRLRGRRRDEQRSLQPRAHSVQSARAPLSVAQEHLWYLSRLAPGNPVYNELVTIRVDGPLSVDSLRAALSEVVRRHEIWRSTFDIAGGEPVQAIHPARPVDLPLIDLSGLSRADADLEAARLAAAEARRPYLLDRGPLIRPLLVRLSADHHRLFLGLHHLIFDGISLYRIVLPELVALYDTYAAGAVPEMADPLIQYSDYAAWTRSPACGIPLAGRIGYWRQRLDGAPKLMLPLDHPRPAQQRFQGAMLPIRIGAELAGELRSLSRRSGGTLFATVATAFAVLMHRYSGQEDVVFATLCDLRDRPELETMVGYCMTPLVLRVDLGGDPSFAQLLARVRSELLDALDHVVPFAQVVRELCPQRQPGANPVFQAMVVMEPPMKSPDSAWSLHQMEAEIGDAVGHAKFDLHLELDERPDGHIDGRLIYRTDLFDPPTAQRMVGHWLKLLEGIVATPGRPVSALPLLTSGERRRQLMDWNATTTSRRRDVCVHTLVAEQSDRTPDATAVVCGEDALTFREVDRRANALAHRLRMAGADAGSIVAICVDRSLDMVVGMLAILKCGAAYLPLDPDHPAGRIAAMIEDSGAPILLTESTRVAKLAHQGRRVVCTDGGEFADEDDHPPPSGATAADPAYVIYTSGSTGRPKGVVVPHAAVANLLASLAREPGIGTQDTVVAVTTYSFDIAAVEIWLPLITGARIVMASREMASDGRLLIRLMAAAGVTVMQATPATWRMLLEAGWEGSPALVALCGGEPLQPRLAELLLERTAELWNMYGPTETTVWSTCGRVRRDSPISIGRPIDNTRVYILDRWGEPVPVGVAGELCIGGAGVATGYLKRPELTAERFVADPFVEGELMYRTGDRARFLNGGDIEHLGRTDHQVKVRGFRVEPGEIEAELLAQPEVDAAVVVARADGDGDQRLVAYAAPAGSLPSARELRSRLRTRLPEYMIPAAIVGLRALPLTSSGKIDRAALPAPDWSGQETAARAQAPRTDLEQRLAHLWSRALGLDHALGVDDDFFDVGGHSLLAARLLADVERELGVELPLASIVDGAGTVAEMASLIEKTRVSGAVARPTAAGQAYVLFVVFPDASSMLTLRHFTAALGPGQPVLGLLPEFSGRIADDPRSLGDVATPMIERIRAEQPHGPYHIAGHSVGGHFAYEIAGRLIASGEEVAWLGLLDCGTPEVVAHHLRWLFSLRGRGAMVSRELRLGARATLSKSAHVTARTLSRLQVTPADHRRSPDAKEFDWRGAMVMASKYECAPHAAPIDLFVTNEMVSRTGSDSLGWEDLHRGPLRVHGVPGDHLTMLVVPHVRILAATLAGSLHHALEVRAAHGD